jgi:hypothetical protein
LLLGLALLQLALNLHYAAPLVVVGDNDPSYYYTVARNVAIGRGLADPIEWEFLDPHRPGRPERILRPTAGGGWGFDEVTNRDPPGVLHGAGAFWSLGWPLFLGAVMSVVGASQKAAIYICAVLSTALPVLVCWLTYRIRPELWVAGMAGLMAILLEDQNCGKVTPDSGIPYTVAVLAAMCVVDAARRQPQRWRWFLAGIAVVVPFCCRGEGFELGLVALWVLLAQPGVNRRDAFLSFAVGALITVAGYLLYHWMAFGAFVPKPRSLGLYLTEYNDLNRFLVPVTKARWLAQGFHVIVQQRWDTLCYRIYRCGTELPWPIGVLALVGIGIGWRRHRDGVRLVVGFMLLAWVVTSVLAPFLSIGRLAGLIFPEECILAALAIAALSERRRWVGALLLLACVRLYWPAATPHWNWRGYTAMPPYLALTLQSPLKLTPQDLVLTSNPFEVAADLDVQTVTAPADGVPEAFYAVIQAYRPHYMIVQAGSTMAGFQEYTHLAGLHIRPVLQAADATWYEFIP